MKKILIIENDKKNGSRAAEALRSGLKDVNIHICLTGLDGLNYLRRKSIDLVISANRLSDMTGFDLLKRMNEIGGNWPAIILLPAGRGDEAERYMKTGIYDYIVKDAEYLKSLPGAVRRALDLNNIFNQNIIIPETDIESERRRELSRIAHVLNHEVNNPLMTIMGNVQLLLSKPETGPAELRDKLSAIEDSAQRIARVMTFFADRNNEQYNEVSRKRQEKGLTLKRP